MFEGRALKANEFVNELLWTDNWDGYAASRSLGGWGSTEWGALSPAGAVAVGIGVSVGVGGGLDGPKPSADATSSGRVAPGDSISQQPTRSQGS